MAVAAKVEEHEKKLDRVMPAVFGADGCPETGLMSRMKSQEDQTNSLVKWIEQQKGMNKILAALATVIGGAVITLIVTLLTK